MPGRRPTERDTSTAAAPPPGPWIARPWIDLVVGCGGWSLPLLAVAYAVGERGGQAWAGVFYAVALVANYPHYMATVYRAYGAEDRGQHRRYTVGGTLVLVLAGLWAHAVPTLLPWLFTAYVVWSPWHYTGQNYGLLMMFAARGGLQVTPAERRDMRAAFVASFVMLLAAFNEGASSDPLVLSLGLPAPLVRLVGAAAAALFVVAGGRTLRSWYLRTRARAVLPVATLFLTQALWFVAPIALTWLAGVRTPQTRYSSGILAVMHSAQYLWITQYFARREQGPAWRADRYWLAVVLGGIALFLPLPWAASYGAHVDFTASMLIVTAVVNLHHFMIDGVVWKLRNPRVGQTLTGAGPLAPAGVPPPPRVAWRRPLVGLGGAALVALAAVDQWRYQLAGRETDPRALRAAVALNPYDAAAEGRLVRLLQASGDTEGLRAHFAWMMARRPTDVDARVNAGVLARQTGRVDDAIARWREAVALDPEATHVHAYLAEALDEADRLEDASVEYRAYAARALRDRRSDPFTVVPILLKGADALARAGHAAEARAAFEQAAGVAAGAGLPDLAAEARRRVEALDRR